MQLLIASGAVRVMFNEPKSQSCVFVRESILSHRCPMNEKYIWVRIFCNQNKPIERQTISIFLFFNRIILYLIIKLINAKN